MDSIKLFKKVTDSISIIFLYILLLALIMGMVKTLLDIRLIIFESLESGFSHMVLPSRAYLLFNQLWFILLSVIFGMNVLKVFFFQHTV